MKAMNLCGTLVFALLVLFAVTTAANAVVLIDATTNNGSFQTPDVGTTWLTSVGTPWVRTGNVVTQYEVTAPDGDQIVSFGWGGTGVQQDTGVAWAANTLYTLNAYGKPKALGTSAQPLTLHLTTTDGSVDVTSVLDRSTTAWRAFPTITLDTSNPLYSGLVGLTNMRVSITQLDAQGDFDQAWFDNVVLTSAAIPEPGTLALAGMALAGLLCYAWRKRK